MNYSNTADKRNEDTFFPLPMSRLESSKKDENVRLAGLLKAGDAASVLDFGVGIQQQIAEFTGSLLMQVKAKDSGDLGTMITELIEKIETGTAGHESGSAPVRTLARIPIVGAMFRSASRSMRNARTLEAHVEAIRAKLDEAYVALHRDMEMLELVLKKNADYFHDLELHISSLLFRLEQAEKEDLPLLIRQAQQSDDPWAQQQLSEQEAFIRQLEKRLDDFNRTRFLSLSQAPRIRLLQQGQQAVMEKIQTVIYQLIPLWKMDLVTGLAQERASRALELQSMVRDHIEQSMRRSAQHLREVTVGMARENEYGMVGMDTLRSIHSELLATLEETLQVYAEGRKQRKEAERELTDMERELQRKIAETIRPGAY